MPRFAANLTMMFTELPFMERFQAARSAGFRAVEYLFPYEVEATDLRRALDDAGLVQVLFNAPPGGDFAKGARGLAALPGREAEYRDSISLALDYARILDVPRIHVMAGNRVEALSEAEQTACYVSALQDAAAMAAKAGVTLLIEPLNPFDMPGYVLSSVQQAAGILQRAGAANLKIQYDLYHQSRFGGDLVGTFGRYCDLIGHIQMAGNPGRHEPDTGEVDYSFVFAELDRLGYAGWIGCEYRPRAGTGEGLGWFGPWKEQA